MNTVTFHKEKDGLCTLSIRTLDNELIHYLITKEQAIKLGKTINKELKE